MNSKLDVDERGGQPPGPARMTIASRWVLDSRWVTRQCGPALSRRIVMRCSVALEPAGGAASAA